MKRAAMVLAAALSLVAGDLCGDDRPAEPGEALFNGSGETDGMVVLGATSRIPARRLACRTCHGRDGLGGKEGNAPAIVWSQLQRATRQRGPYDEAALAKVLRYGTGLDGRRLGQGMPRYELSEPLFHSLLAYLRDLPARAGRGITRHAVTFGVLAPAGSEKQARDYADALEEALLEATDGRPVHDRSLRVVLVSGTPAEMIARADENVAAVIGMPRAEDLDIQAFTSRGIPVLFPLFPLTGEEDTSLVRGLMADEDDALRALADRILRNGVKRLAVLDDDKCGKASSAQAHAVETRSGKDVDAVFLSIPDLLDGGVHDADALLLLCDDAESAARIVAATSPEIPIYGLGSALNRATGIADGRRAAYLAVEQAVLADAMVRRGDSPSKAHAAIAAGIIGRALRSSGRKISRYSIVSAIDRVSLEEFGLNYGIDALNGTSEVLVIERGGAAHP